jgi:hypothetical protein
MASNTSAAVTIVTPPGIAMTVKSLGYAVAVTVRSS